jgi:hypothetical protein
LSKREIFYKKSDLTQLNTNIPFNTQDPYPLLPEGSYTYEAAKVHSILVDRWLGFPETENQPMPSEKAPREDHEIIKLKSQTWQHLSPQQFQTPYCELREMLERLKPKPHETIIDLGCGYGRMAFVLEKHFPMTKFQGFEIAAPRVNKAKQKFQENNLQNSTIEVADITALSFTLPPADTYFIFDFGHNFEIQQVLENLQKIASQKSIQVIGRGRATRHFIQTFHPWLSVVNDPQHTAHYSIYKS